MPIRPLGLAADLLHAVPGEAVAADADAVADRTATAEHVVEVGIGRIDHDGARGLLGRRSSLPGGAGSAEAARAQLPAALPAAARQAAPACRRLRRRVAAVAGALRWRRSPPAGAGQRDRRSDRRCRHRECGCRRDPNRPVAANRRAVRIDHRRRAGRTAVTRIIGRKDRARGHRSAAVRINGSTGRAAIARVVGRKNRARGHRRAAVRINRSTGRTAIAGIGGRQHRAGRRQRGRILRVRRIVIVQVASKSASPGPRRSSTA